jgi:Uma2 family endonuclease
MTPAPTRKHQDVVGNFYTILKTSLENPCYTGIAPTDVVFDEYNVVQPDVFLVCDRGKVLETHIQGPSDLIIEVVSKRTVLKDRKYKRLLYERHGVKEYIVVFPDDEYLERYILQEGKYEPPEIYGSGETIKLVIADVEIELKDVFKF